jgi:hypothetical protein
VGLTLSAAGRKQHKQPTVDWVSGQQLVQSTPLHGLASAWVAISLALLFVPCALAQTWTTGFFNTNQGWVQGDFVTGQNTNDAASVQWQGNDPESEISPGVFVGGTDIVAFANGYTPFGSGSGNSSLVQGGAYLTEGYFPGTNSVILSRQFSPVPVGPGGTVSFYAEWSLIGSLNVTYPNLDTFSFDLRNAANTESLLTLQLAPGINIQPNSYTLQALAGGSPTQTLVDLAYQSLFQIQVDLTGSTYDVTLNQINSIDRTNIATFILATGESLAAGTTVEDFGTVAVNWDLTSGDPAQPGSNYIVVNEITVVPEPRTYALFGVAAIALALVAMRRRRA